MKKRQLNEEQIINEFIGKIASYMFMNKANKLVNATKKNSELHKAIEKYHKDNLEFKKKLKRIGVTSPEDLVKAVNKDPNVRDMETDRQAKDRIDKELDVFF
jgi:hypothetical protein